MTDEELKGLIETLRQENAEEHAATRRHLDDIFRRRLSSRYEKPAEERRYEEALFAQLDSIRAGAPSDPRGESELKEARRDFQVAKLRRIDEKVDGVDREIRRLTEDLADLRADVDRLRSFEKT